MPIKVNKKFPRRNFFLTWRGQFERTVAMSALALALCFGGAPQSFAQNQTDTSPERAGQGRPIKSQGKSVPRATLRGTIEPDLMTQLNGVIGTVSTAPASRFEARRRAREAADLVAQRLRSEGYYGAQVTAALSDDDPESDQAPDPDDGTASTVADPIVQVDPGPQFRLHAGQADWIAPEPDTELRTKTGIILTALADQPARAVSVLTAEGQIIQTLDEAGYADAKALPRRVIVDHADQSMTPIYRIAAGDRVQMGPLDLSARGRTSGRWLASLQPWKTGDRYSPGALAELERRLVETGVYDAVSVTLAPKADGDPVSGFRPVRVVLGDRRPQSYEIAAGYATEDGPGLDVRYSHYNRLHRGDTLTLLGRLSVREQRLEAQSKLPHWQRVQQTLTGKGVLVRYATEAYDAYGLTLNADVVRRLRPGRNVTAGLGLEGLRVTAKDVLTRSAGLPPPERSEDSYAVSVLGAFSEDRTDSLLNPTRGWRFEGRAEPTYAFGTVQQTYVRTQAQVSAYLPLGDKAKTVIAGRLKAGSLLGTKAGEIPALRRFYAGGGGSVRGYAYQAIGPRLADNTPIGGASLFEASLELRQSITPAWAVVAFVDAGAVSEAPTPSTRDLASGAGVGVRYDLGFAPLRFDVAVPLERRAGDAKFQIYISLGQSF